MYEAYFGFREKPFNLTPDPKFLYLSPKHHEAFAHLSFGLEQRGGFMVVTGEVGTGKTTLCRYFLDRLDENTISAFVIYPALSTTELLCAINCDLGIPCDGDRESEKSLIDALHRFLLDAHRDGKNVVVVIDEAQNLSRDVLEQVRLISNLETDTEKLIQIILIGQTELNEMLAQRDLRQLAQRVTARYHLTPLSRDEIKRYVDHRLAVAGRIGAVGFAPGALRAIRAYSNGVPRLINLACDRTLLAGYVLEEKHISADVARRAVAELEPPTFDAPEPWFRRLSWPSALLLVALAVLAGLASLAGVAVATGELPWGLTAAKGAVLEIAPGPDLAARTQTEQTEQFALRLATLSEDASRRASTDVLLERWGITAAERDGAGSSAELMAALAGQSELESTEIETTLEQLQVMDAPAVLEMSHPARSEPLYLALTSIASGTATVHFAPGDAYELPLDVVERYWTGRARLFWRDYDDLASMDVSSRLAWARARLQALGLLAPNREPQTEAFASALAELQKRILSSPTGNVGEETRMALYSLGSTYRTPRLVTP